jgi:hypothetical protein
MAAGTATGSTAVVFVPFSGGRPNGKAQDVVTGFLDANGEARGRPVGVTVDKTGALLIGDDVGNTVWRVTSADQHHVAGAALLANRRPDNRMRVRMLFAAGHESAFGTELLIGDVRFHGEFRRISGPSAEIA